MEISELKAFVAIAEHLSFSHAAETLHITQPAISKRLSLLEQKLNQQLFDRLGRQVALTDAGKALYPRAVDILQAVDNTRNELNNLQHQVSGELSFATSHHIGLHRLPEVLREFNLLFPQVKLNIKFLESEQGIAAVQNRTVEFAFVTLPQRAIDRIDPHCLWEDELIYVAGLNHPLSKRTDKIRLNELCYSNSILPEPGTITHQLIEQQFSRHKLPLHIGIPVNYLETIKMLVVSGLGWSVLPKIMVTDSITPLKTGEQALQRKLGYVKHRDRTLSNAARALLGLISSNQ